MNDLLNVFALTFIGSVVSLFGGLIFLYNNKLSRFLEIYSIPFAASVMITTSILGIIPEAFEMIGNSTFLIVLFSFFISYLFEKFIFGIHHHSESDHKHDHDIKSSVPLVIVGDTIHNFIDGVAIGASYLISPGLGVITAVSTFLHEIPHEIGDFGILVKAGWEKRKILLVNLLSALAAIFGAVILFKFSENTILIGSLLSISAGIFLYLGSVDFLPHINNNGTTKIKSILALVFGFIIMALVLFAVPHGHEDEDSHDSEESGIVYAVDDIK